MSKTELEELLHIRKEIEQLEKRIARIEKQSIMASDVVQNGFKRHAIIYGVDVKRAYKLQNYYEKLKKFNIMLVEKEAEIEDYIETIPFSEIRQIFRLKYIDGLNWIQVAHEMNKEYKGREYSENSVRCKHDRYLQSIQ